MKIIAVFWIFFCAVFQVCPSNSQRVNVSVLYESLCPDSIRFITRQLQPAYQDLKEHLQVELVPFGKARIREDPWEMSCQHGKHECLGNILQACTLDELSNNNEKQIKFVSCVMSNSQSPEACANSIGVPYEKIQICTEGEKYKQLMIRLQNRTKELKSPLTFVPTIVFNGVFDQDAQDNALYRFKETVCSKLENSNALPACKNLQNQIFRYPYYQQRYPNPNQYNYQYQNGYRWNQHFYRK